MKRYNFSTDPKDKDKVMAELRKILLETSKMSKKHKKMFYLGTDEKNDLVVRPELKSAIHNLYQSYENALKHGLLCIYCMVHDDSFSTDAYHYKLDKMVSILYDAMTHNLIQFGHLGFLSEGELQLWNASSIGKRLVKKHGKALILGMNERSQVILAPYYMKSLFVIPSAFLISKYGEWFISSMHYTRYAEMHMGGFWHSNPERTPYNLFVRGYKVYKPFSDNYDTLVIQLENALEDAAIVSQFFKEPFSIFFTYKNMPMLLPAGKSSRSSKNKIVVRPNSLWNGTILKREKIQQLAHHMYENHHKDMAKKVKSR